MPTLSRSRSELLRVLALVAFVLLLTTTAGRALAQDAAAATSGSAEETDQWFTNIMKSQGVFVGMGGAFVVGLLINLTPCVYPLIVITTSVFGARQAQSRGRAMILSSIYVLGIVVLYTSVFVGASLAGSGMGVLLQKAWVNVAVASIFLALAASSFGAFEIRLPDFIMQRVSTAGGTGFLGAFLIGLVSGLVAAPCSGPATVSIALWMTTAHNVPLSILIGVAMSIGLGLPTWFVGSFALGLPKGGRWMVWVKSLFGCVLIVLALWYLKNPFPQIKSFATNDAKFIVPIAAITVLGLALGAIHVNWDDGYWNTKIQKGIGIAATSAGGFLLVVALGLHPNRQVQELKAQIDSLKAQNEDLTDRLKKGDGAPLPVVLPEKLPVVEEWSNNKTLDSAVSKAATEKRPLLIDFGADWCAACHELENKTFSDDNFRVGARRFVPVHVDLTADDDDSPENKAIKAKYKVTENLPLLLLIDSEGKEKRIVGFIEPEKLLQKMEGVD